MGRADSFTPGSIADTFDRACHQQFGCSLRDFPTIHAAMGQLARAIADDPQVGDAFRNTRANLNDTYYQTIARPVCE